jgi:hypothetical protein
MDSGVKHTTAAEMDMFLQKSQASQLLEIWLNGRETNGSVAEVKRDLNEAKRTAEKTAVALSEHLAEQHEHELVVTAIKKWGYRGTVGLAVLVTAFGGPQAVMEAAKLVQAFRGG